MSVEMEMPRYVSHKQVWALKIKAIEPFGADGMFARLHFEDPRYAPIAVDADWYYGRKPEAGGYYVVYQDSYKSYSPAKVFEEGYTPQNAAHAVQAAPQAGEDAASQVEYLDVENHRLRRAMQKIMARLADLLDEDQFGNIESIVTEAGVEPPEHAAQATRDAALEEAAAKIDAMKTGTTIDLVVQAFADAVRALKGNSHE